MHVLHPSLWATLRSVVHSENTPPLWYVIAWADSRVLGTGEVALRLPSALAGIATVPVAWAIGRELYRTPRGDRLRRARGGQPAVRVVLAGGARVRAVRADGRAGDALLPARRAGSPRGRRMAAFALAGALALLTHYFAVFLLIPMVLGCCGTAPRRRLALAARRGAIGLVGLALLPLISAQGGHGTQWIGRWPLRERLEAIPQYYLTGYSGAPLGPRHRAARGAADPRRARARSVANARSRRTSRPRERGAAR